MVGRLEASQQSTAGFLCQEPKRPDQGVQTVSHGQSGLFRGFTGVLTWSCLYFSKISLTAMWSFLEVGRHSEQEYLLGVSSLHMRKEKDWKRGQR